MLNTQTHRFLGMIGFVLAAMGSSASAQEVETAGDPLIDQAYSQGYDTGYSEGYAAAVREQYEAQLRALYAERQSLTDQQAAPEQVSAADAALVEAFLAIQPQCQAMYFEAMSDLQAQNAAYWAALESAIYAAAQTIDEEIVYTYYGVPAWFAPYAGYYAATGAWVACGAAAWNYPVYPTYGWSAQVDGITNNIEVNINEANVDELAQQAQAARQERLNQLQGGEGTRADALREQAQALRDSGQLPSADEARSALQERVGQGEGQLGSLREQAQGEGATALRDRVEGETGAALRDQLQGQAEGLRGALGEGAASRLGQGNALTGDNAGSLRDRAGSLQGQAGALRNQAGSLQGSGAGLGAGQHSLGSGLSAGSGRRPSAPSFGGGRAGGSRGGGRR